MGKAIQKWTNVIGFYTMYITYRWEGKTTQGIMLDEQM